MVSPMILMNEKARCLQRLRNADLRKFLNIEQVVFYDGYTDATGVMNYSLLRLFTGLASAARTAL